MGPPAAFLRILRASAEAEEVSWLKWTSSIFIDLASTSVVPRFGANLTSASRPVSRSPRVLHANIESVTISDGNAFTSNERLKDTIYIDNRFDFSFGRRRYSQL